MEPQHGPTIKQGQSTERPRRESVTNTDKEHTQVNVAQTTAPRRTSPAYGTRCPAKKKTAGCGPVSDVPHLTQEHREVARLRQRRGREEEYVDVKDLEHHNSQHARWRFRGREMCPDKSEMTKGSQRRNRKGHRRRSTEAEEGAEGEEGSSG